MALTTIQTGYKDIIVKVDGSKSPGYGAMVKESLKKIYSKPAGKKLINGILAHGEAKFGYKVCIMRPDMSVGVHEASGMTMIGGGNLAVRISEEKACNGDGTQTKVVYNHNTINTPDGARPNFIGLAHELVHALHNLQGVAKKQIVDEEHWTVGIGQYANTEICENSIRAEHKVPRRAKYTDPGGA